MKIVSFVVGLIVLCGFFLSPALASAVDVLEPACRTAPGAEACGGDTGDPDDDSDEQSTGNAIYGPEGVLTKVANLIIMIVGIASVIMIMIGGFKYITSSGDPANTKSAKDTIMFAIIGILVAVFGQAMLILVVNRL